MESTDDDMECKELITLVTDILQKNGAMNQIKAQIRASVFAAIEKEELDLRPEQSILIKKLLGSRNGQVSLAVIFDFLKFLNLEFTMSVFQPEIDRGVESDLINREEICSLLSLSNDESKPLLCTIIDEISRERNNSTSEVLSKSEENSDIDIPKQLLPDDSDKNNADAVRTDSSRPEAINNGHPPLLGDSTHKLLKSVDIVGRKKSGEDRPFKFNPSSQTSLSGLPPLKHVKNNLVNSDGDEPDFKVDSINYSLQNMKYFDKNLGIVNAGDTTEELLEDLSPEEELSEVGDVTEESTVSVSSGKCNDFIVSV